MHDTHDDCPMCRFEAKWREEGRAPDRDDGAGNTSWTLSPEQIEEVFGSAAVDEPGTLTLIRIALPKLPLRQLGRNDLCWCGSGHKYERCHLGTVAN